MSSFYGNTGGHIESVFAESWITEKVEAAVEAQIPTIQTETLIQIGLVSDEGNTQVNAVEAKGAEVLASIPEDYTTLNNEVEQLLATKPYVDSNDYIVF